MKIAIIENEKREVEGAFSYLNASRFANKLEFIYFETAQDFLRASFNYETYGAVIIDIHLTKKSHLDGFGLIKKILELVPKIKDKIIILTGFHKVPEKLSELHLPSLPIVVKPANFDQILQAFKVVKLTPRN